MMLRKEIIASLLSLNLLIYAKGQTIKHSGGKPVVAAAKMNILYTLTKNPVNIAVPDFPCNKLLVSSSNGLLTGKDCEYSIVPEHVGETVITVMAVQENDTIILGEEKFRVKRPDLPKAYFCNSKTKVKKEIAIECAYLVLHLDGFDFDPPFRIINFDLIINGGSQMSATGNELTAEMKNALKKTEAGDILEFKNIKALALEAAPNTIVAIEDFKISIE
jgi:hypothetical protein